jgi:hypothetical protein
VCADVVLHTVAAVAAGHHLISPDITYAYSSGVRGVAAGVDVAAAVVVIASSTLLPAMRTV